MDDYYYYHLFQFNERWFREDNLYNEVSLPALPFRKNLYLVKFNQKFGRFFPRRKL